MVAHGLTASRPVLFLSHEATRSGAPLVLLNLLRWLRAHTDLPMRIVLFQDGPLAGEFADLAPTTVLNSIGIGRSQLLRRIGRIPVAGQMLKHCWHRLLGPHLVRRDNGGSRLPALIYANTVGTARLIRQLAPPGVPLLVHVHELERAIRIAAGDDGMAALKARAARFIAISAPVRDNLILRHGIDADRIELIPSFITWDQQTIAHAQQFARQARQRLNIPADALVIGGCGATDWRKGADLFVEMAIEVSRQLSPATVHFVWVGPVLDDDFTNSIMRRVRSSGIGSSLHFVGEHSKPMQVFCAMDVFVLSSREEPLGLVGLEAASLGKPIVCFAGAGGMPDFVGDDCGRVVAPMTPQALAQAVIELGRSAPLRDQMGRCGMQRVRQRHLIDAVAPQILELIRQLASRN
ncbi:MAG TPA: glycosyltransferase family 4 protein [Tepidisphaeraceae bacterium]|nr:glycosyltransferase family 4 protein [Tepidisphaeraceae bacterium]